jgi:CRP-like cAMP-binding protein
MSELAVSLDFEQTAIRRLGALYPLEPKDRTTLHNAIATARTVPVRRELLSERRPIPGPMLIVSGWAARVRILMDGRRQFLSFLLPGDLIGICHHRQPLAVSTVTTLTDVSVCPLPAGVSPRLDEAYRISEALEDAYLLCQITRLGRLNAEERIGDLLLELHERLTLAGLAQGGSFDVPLTQEMLADATGLTAVHVNRMLQSLRRSNDLVWKGSRVTLPDAKLLARKVCRAPVRVSAAVA